MDKYVSLGSVKGTITPPSSKSYAQRAIALALLAEGRTVLRNIEFCKDTRSALKCIEALGAKVEFLDESTLAIEGGLNPKSDTLLVGESGLATRLFTPIASLNRTPITIKGEGTLLYRPMSMMIDPLRQLGVTVRDGGGHLPIEVQGPIHGGEVSVDGSVSSQFITGLLLALPLAEEDTTLHVTSPVSTPYIDMTIDTAQRFGINIMQNKGDYTQFFIEGNQKYTPTDLSIEGDWSGASYWYELAAVAAHHGYEPDISLQGMRKDSRQGDRVVAQLFEELGVKTEYNKEGAKLLIDNSQFTIHKSQISIRKEFHPLPRHSSNDGRDLLLAGHPLCIYRHTEPAHQGDRPRGGTHQRVEEVGLRATCRR